MKKTVLAINTINGITGSINLELLLDINRELTDIDDINIRKHIDNLLKDIKEESIRLNPQSAIDASNKKIALMECFGDRIVFVEEIPNGYDSSYYSKHLPWFIVTTNKGRIKIGWRKRVINIDWTDSTINDDAYTLFPDEDVTRYEKTIHAWGYDKAKEYINVLLK